MKVRTTRLGTTSCLDAIVGVLFSVLAAACSGSSGGGTGSPTDSDAGTGADSGGGATAEVICDRPATSGGTPETCNIYTLPSGEASVQAKDCATGSDPGTVVMSCKLTGLTGCCKLPPTAYGTNEICYYGGGANANGCTGGANGTWSTMP